jgi:hypothetical protein
MTASLAVRNYKNHRMGTNNPSRLPAAFALVAKLAASMALAFVLLSAISTADDDVQQEALAQPQLNVFRICKPVLPAVLSADLVIASFSLFEPITRYLYKVHEPDVWAPLSESLRPLLGRSPPRIFPF